MATKKVSTKKRGNVITVDFTGVSSSGGGVLLPEGPITLEVDEISQEVGRDSGEPYLAFKFKVVGGKYEGKACWDNMSLTPQALWKLKGFLEAAEVEIEDSVNDLDLDELIGLIVQAEIIHEEYKGKSKSRVGAYMTAEETDEQEQAEEEEKEQKKTAGKKAAAKEEASDDEDEEGEFKLKQKVKFKEGKKFISGVITEIDGDTVTVKAGDDEYEMETGDLQPA